MPVLILMHTRVGGFYNSETIPKDRPAWSPMAAMAARDDNLMRYILESPYPRESNVRAESTDSRVVAANSAQRTTFSPARLPTEAMLTDEENFDTMQKVYNACMEEGFLRSLGVQPLVQLVQTVADSFPVAEDDDGKIREQDYAALSETILLLQRMGVQTFVSLDTGPDPRDPVSDSSSTLAQSEAVVPKLELQLDDVVDNAAREAFVAAVTELFGKLHPRGSSRDSAAKLAKSVADLESSLLALEFQMQQQDTQESCHIENVATAGKLASLLGLDYVVNNLAPSNYSVDSIYASELPDSPYNSGLLQRRPEPRYPGMRLERWKICLSHTQAVVPWILSRFYLDATFSEESKLFAEQIIRGVKQQFASNIKGLNWMDEPDKDLAIEKVHNVDAKIGYPTGSPEVMSPDALKRWYSNLNITNSLFDNSISAKVNDVNRTWPALGKPVDRNHWHSKAYEANAYHYRAGNEIVFPAGIMQTPQLHVDWPLYLSYGGFGFIAGHELTHAFDNNGRCFDQHRNYTDWWTNHTKEEFSRRTDCFVNQYGHFNVYGPQGRTYPVDGALTLNENIADAGGVTPAYAAWKQRQGEKADQDLPGLDFFTHDQLFHIALAQERSSANMLLDAGWCQKARDETATLLARFDVHSPPFARILGTLANQRSFLEAFDCPRKQPNCQLW
ncbi:uncharacterized protein PG986_009146 [Apiospora aurea]|uniref:Uncharacterized protein n=1 Tax=Apiospora aurea TaxID=335848 RepID=A0ABR1Q6W8_9PEZI